MVGIVKGEIIGSKDYAELEVRVKQVVGSDYGENSIEILSVQESPYKIERECLQVAISNFILSAVSTGGNPGLLVIDGDASNVEMDNNRFLFRIEFECRSIDESQGAW